MRVGLCSPCFRAVSLFISIHKLGLIMMSSPGMADADAVVYIAQYELEELVGQNTSSIGKPEERMIRKDSPQAHGPSVQDAFVAQTAETAVTMNNLDALTNADVAEDGEEGKYCGEGGLAVDDEEGHVVNLEAIGEVADALAVVVGVGDDDDLVAAVDELAGELVDVRLDAAGLREEEVADHGNAIRTPGHLGGVGG